MFKGIGEGSSNEKHDTGWKGQKGNMENLESNTGRCTTRQYGLVGPRESEKNLLGDCKQDLRIQTCSRGFISRKLAAHLPAPGDLAAALRMYTLLISRVGACEEKLLVCLVPRLVLGVLFSA